MSNNDENSKSASPPSYSGNMVPKEVNTNMDDGREEVTRRVGGVVAQPDFGALVSPLQAPSASPLSSYGASSLSAVPQKSSSSPGVQQKAPPHKGSWTLSDVPTLPEYHPLERTAVLVENASPSQVSQRISDVLRERSIEAIYEDDKAKVKCVTSDGIDFRIRLYRGRGNYSHGIIVEVQRRFGASINFHKDTQAILDAAQGNAPPPLKSSSSGLPLLVSDSEEDFSPLPPGESLQTVVKMLSHPGYDSHYLALQTLTSLTDASKMGPATARNVSTELLLPDNPVGSRILGLIVEPKKQDDDFNLRVMALTVLANAIQSVQGNVSNIVVGEQVRPVLIQELGQADASPRAAYQAARCLEWLLLQEEKGWSSSSSSELRSALEQALQVGQARHADLERQAQVCLNKM